MKILFYDTKKYDKDSFERALTEFDEIENEGQSFDRKMHDIKNFSSQKGLFH